MIILAPIQSVDLLGVSSFACWPLNSKHRSIFISMAILLDIPDEVIIKILWYLNQHELAQAALLSKKMKNLARASILWKRMKIYASPNTQTDQTRSSESLISMINSFVNLRTIQIFLRHSWNGDTPGDDIKYALENILNNKASIKAVEIHLNNQSVSECHTIYKVLEHHGSSIESIKILEDGPGTFWRWEDWTEEIIHVAPKFWYHLKMVELKDGGIRSLIVEDGALVKIIQNTPCLQTLVINSGSMLKANQIQDMLKAMEEHDKIMELEYKTIWDILGRESLIGSKCFISGLFNAGIKYDATDAVMIIYARRI